jgi:hypothetical protein
MEFFLLGIAIAVVLALLVIGLVELVSWLGRVSFARYCRKMDARVALMFPGA